MHVDGFRFDLASILTRDSNGAPLHNPPVIEAISKDPILASCKLIAEAWDAGGLYQVGSFPAYGRWAEWNGKYRDTVRKFIKGTDGVTGDFSRALSGSQDIYGYTRKPYHSVNFITAHDGFSLKDLVSYNQKHNTPNGEDNRDGTNDNESWNCGAEGPTQNPKVLQFRERQMRNFHTALMVSLGTPMLLMGDEYGHTNLGNNNMWCHDSPNWFEWDKLDTAAGFYRFYKKMIAFRKQTTLLRRSEFLTDQDVDWHGHFPFKADWSGKSRFVAYTLKDHAAQSHLYIAFNADHSRTTVHLPDPPPHKQWYRIVDTALKTPFDFIEEPEKSPPLKTIYRMEAYSALVAQAL
jgi:isoamylase/glycogen operon protein